MKSRASDQRPCAGTCVYCRGDAPLVEAPDCTCSCGVHASSGPKGPKGKRGEEGFPGGAVVEISHRLLVGVHECKDGRHGEVCTKTQEAVHEAMKLGRGRMETILRDMRSDGWKVAVHNDYVLDGEHMTFWGFSRGAEWVRGEGETDVDALESVVATLAARKSSEVSDPVEADLTRLAETARLTRWKIDPVDHLPLLVQHPTELWTRTECKCGHKGAWLRNNWQCLPCPRAPSDAKFYFVVATNFGDLYGMGTVAEVAAWLQATKAETPAARKRLPTGAEVERNVFQDLSTRIY